MQPPDLTAPAPELESELEAFRLEWKREAAQRRQAAPAPPAASTSSQVSPPRTSPKRSGPVIVDEAPPELDRLSLRDRQTEPDAVGVEQESWRHKVRSVDPPRSAIELYAGAVQAEREGRLNDALSQYRAAFKKDADVDKAYHRSLQSAPATSPTRQTFPGLAPKPVSDAFAFEKTVQLTPDYVAEREHRSARAVREGMGASPKEAVEEDDQHPSSTRFLLTSLLRSFERSPFIPVKERASSVQAAGEAVRTHGDESKPFDIAFIRDDDEIGFGIAKLPHEVLILILRQVVFNSVTPPPKPRLDPNFQPPAGKKGKPKAGTKEEREWIEMELGLESSDQSYKIDVEALERFGRTCRASRVLTLDEGIWRDLCSRVYVSPHQISREEDAFQIANEQHAGDWRRCFIEHPRIRMDGAYIAVVTYLRRGDTQAWYSPTHVITFYRFLRFYPSGLVLSYLTVDPPSEVVKKLNPALKAKGLTRGRWRLRGEMVEAWGLEDSSVKQVDRKYSFRMNCRLRSTARGRMNKLEMISLATENRANGELEDVPIKPTKPFYFSKVASYAALDE